jgi:hypothetical protein
MSVKNSDDSISNRSRDIPVCGAVSQPLRYRVPQIVNVWYKIQILYRCINFYWKIILVCMCNDYKATHSFVPLHGECRWWGEMVKSLSALNEHELLSRCLLLIMLRNSRWLWYHTPVLVRTCHFSSFRLFVFRGGFTAVWQQVNSQSGHCNSTCTQ